MSEDPMALPETPQEWQAAVDVAQFWLIVDSAEKYGLVTGPLVDVERCEYMLSRGKELGYTPEILVEATT